MQKNKIALCAALVSIALPLSAADPSSQRSSSQQSPGAQGSQMGQSSQYDSSKRGMASHQKASSQECSSVSKILDANAKSRDGQDLGDVEDLVINPQTGKIEFVVLGQGGVLGLGEDRIPVPWRAVNFQQDGTLTINQDKAKLQSAPSVKRDYSNLNDPGYTVTIYEFYAIPMSAGGSEGPAGMNQGSNKGLGSDQKANQDTTPNNQ